MGSSGSQWKEGALHMTQDIQSQTRVSLQLALTTPVSITVLMVNSREMAYLLILISLAVMGGNSPEVNRIAVL